MPDHLVVACVRLANFSMAATVGVDPLTGVWFVGQRFSAVDLLLPLG